jgi:NAD-dependent deacetylase
MDEIADSVSALRRLIEQSQTTVMFTGAGISTESGIPDYRSPGGIWTKMQPIDFSDFISSEEMRRESWRRKIASGQTFSKAEPNRGHRAVAELVSAGKVSSVITQNVDGLHQASGVPTSHIIELHGNATFARCLTCGKRYELAPICQAFAQDETLPECGDCGGLIKTATISFGQSMPEEEMRRAQEQTYACDLFLVLGSSLVVYPAADLPRLAKENGAKLAILNREDTSLDPIADLVLHSEIGPTLGEAVGID